MVRSLSQSPISCDDHVTRRRADLIVTPARASVGSQPMLCVLADRPWGRFGMRDCRIWQLAGRSGAKDS